MRVTRRARIRAVDCLRIAGQGIATMVFPLTEKRAAGWIDDFSSRRSGATYRYAGG